eukprot:TRINITY_DN7360_c0_g1_i3.p1 TRINITY_DN7360_c0_g1~~TRINITY_DN7360_c0_g1_i3.p1  ORF type:complete len:564 (-),score=28.29 TRINITY_DN7360_c0_g1_i3:64-1755(-)
MRWQGVSLVVCDQQQVPFREFQADNIEQYSDPQSALKGVSYIINKDHVPYEISCTNFSDRVISVKIFVDSRKAHRASAKLLSSGRTWRQLGFQVDSDHVSQSSIIKDPSLETSEEYKDKYKVSATDEVGVIEAQFFNTVAKLAPRKEVNFPYRSVAGVALPAQEVTSPQRPPATVVGGIINTSSCPLGDYKTVGDPFAILRIYYRDPSEILTISDKNPLKGVPFSDPKRWREWALNRLSFELLKLSERTTVIMKAPSYILSSSIQYSLAPIEPKMSLYSCKSANFIERLSKYASDMDLIIHQTEIGDKSVFRSLAHQLFDDERQYTMVENSIQTEIDYFVNHYTKLSSSVEQQAFYNRGISMIAFSNFWQVSLLVVSAIESSRPVYYFYKPEFDRFEGKTFVIGHLDGDHFVSLVSSTVRSTTSENIMTLTPIRGAPTPAKRTRDYIDLSQDDELPLRGSGDSLSKSRRLSLTNSETTQPASPPSYDSQSSSQYQTSSQSLPPSPYSPLSDSTSSTLSSSFVSPLTHRALHLTLVEDNTPLSPLTPSQTKPTQRVVIDLTDDD